MLKLAGLKSVARKVQRRLFIWLAIIVVLSVAAIEVAADHLKQLTVRA